MDDKVDGQVAANFGIRGTSIDNQLIIMVIIGEMVDQFATNFENGGGFS